MNEAKLIARKLQMSRLGFLPSDLSRKELQREWKKLVEAGKIPVLLRGTLPGEYEMRRRNRARPGRKKKLRCVSCGNSLGEYHNHGLCNECESKQQEESKTMNIPKMSKQL
ncbi:MAG TPA: hypothetical protein ENI23_04485 [bacterium]|nr:hypothetical protein [bacterium]